MEVSVRSEERSESVKEGQTLGESSIASTPSDGKEVGYVKEVVARISRAHLKQIESAEGMMEEDSSPNLAQRQTHMLEDDPGGYLVPGDEMQAD
ncbi:hypothetical protein CMV_011826 [Castanea mollissima]|uniref:Uncharacterized protein n=1 Tax=Castanea mollissima TaxID=60419 RepID=A0A8J4RGS8_9ROSI|nr:hypothetical protein CMV_011826 [Castanea mollissima]